MGFPSTLPSILFHRIRPSREQKVINGIIAGILGYHSFDTNRSLFYFLQGPARHTSFAMKRAARLTHHSSYQYNINRTMCAEIEFFRDNLKSESDIKWETPAHLIPRTPFATTIGDSSLEGGTGILVAHSFSRRNHPTHTTL